MARVAPGWCRFRIQEIWSPDEHWLLYASNRIGGILNLHRKPASGAGNEEVVLESPLNKVPESWWNDTVLFAVGQGVASLDVFRVALEPDGERTAMPVLNQDFGEFHARVSPDGRWIAYVSVQSTTMHVYVRSYPDLAGPWLISGEEGGVLPRWSRDSRELYYVRLRARGSWRRRSRAMERQSCHPTPRLIISARIRGDHLPGGTPYDVTEDGRFLVNEIVESAPTASPAAQAQAAPAPSITVLPSASLWGR
jgi:hypothetical protein